MPPKARSSQDAAKKAPRPAITRKSDTPSGAPTAAVESESAPNEPTVASESVTKRLHRLLATKSTKPKTVVDFIISPLCGLESIHIKGYSECRNISPLLMAVEANRLDVVQLLVTEHKPNVNAMAQLYERGVTALHIAAHNGNLEMIKYFVEQLGCDAMSLNEKGLAPLDYALRGGHLKEVTQYLLDKGIPPFALHSVSMRSAPNIAMHLLSKGCDPNQVDAEGCTPLFYAAPSARDYLDTVKLLIEHGANPNTANSKGDTPLMQALWCDANKCAEYLLAHGADPNQRGGYNHTNPLIVACGRFSSPEQFEAIKALLAKGALVDAVDQDGNSPLHKAIDMRNSQLATCLINEYGANIHLQNEQRQTPLAVACQTGLVDVARLLVAKGASTDLVLSFGRTLLSLAPSWAHSELAEVLGSRQ